MPSITVKHNIEMAHRLTLLPGKCQQIHGHSMKVNLELYVEFGDHGYALDADGEILDYGLVKKAFRDHLNNTYDHRLVLNAKDEWAKVLQDVDQHNGSSELPGLKKVPGDPTTENLAFWISQWAKAHFGLDCQVVIWETETNATSCGG